MSLPVTPPDTTEVKTVLRDAVSYGTVQKMANLLGVSHSEISRQYDPNHDKKTPIAESLRHFAFLKMIDPEAFQIVKTYYLLTLEMLSDPAPATEKGLSTLLGDAAEKLNALQRARFIDARSENVQRELLLAIIGPLQQFQAGLGKQMDLKSDNKVEPFQRKANGS